MYIYVLLSRTRYFLYFISHTTLLANTINRFRRPFKVHLFNTMCNVNIFIILSRHEYGNFLRAAVTGINCITGYIRQCQNSVTNNNMNNPTDGHTAVEMLNVNRTDWIYLLSESIIYFIVIISVLKINFIVKKIKTIVK